MEEDKTKEILDLLKLVGSSDKKYVVFEDGTYGIMGFGYTQDPNRGYLMKVVIEDDKIKTSVEQRKYQYVGGLTLNALIRALERKRVKLIHLEREEETGCYNLLIRYPSYHRIESLVFTGEVPYLLALSNQEYYHQLRVLYKEELENLKQKVDG